ncbi:hypothetical protein ABZ508_35465 [Streptomyces lavendulocolor]|uniref:Uncharacterized protein n=1 Tax=Streptomyces lavendulocolor TaxID=67316 RepID=A0ABV2WH55_9ACTN
MTNSATSIPDRSARLGEAIVRAHLARVTQDDTPQTRAERGWMLAQVDPQAADRAARGDGVSVITDAVTHILHLADGWYVPESVLIWAFGAHWAQDLPAEWPDAAYGGQEPRGPRRFPSPVADVRDRDALAGAVADLYAAAADRFDAAAEEVADAAEEKFWDEAQAARFDAVRRARTI